MTFHCWRVSLISERISIRQPTLGKSQTVKMKSDTFFYLGALPNIAPA